MHCLECGLTPEQLTEYIFAARSEETTPEQFVLENEGTFNPETQKFWCTSCYIKIGMPLGLARDSWRTDTR